MNTQQLLQHLRFSALREASLRRRLEESQKRLRAQQATASTDADASPQEKETDR